MIVSVENVTLSILVPNTKVLKGFNKSVSVVEMLMYNSQKKSKCCLNLKIHSCPSLFTFLRTIVLICSVTGSKLRQCFAVRNSVFFSLIFSSGRENSNFHNFALEQNLLIIVHKCFYLIFILTYKLIP